MGFLFCGTHCIAVLLSSHMYVITHYIYYFYNSCVVEVCKVFLNRCHSPNKHHRCATPSRPHPNTPPGWGEKGRLQDK